MTSASNGGAPFSLTDGWPNRLSGSGVTAIEAGIALGAVLIEEADWEALRASVVLTLRIDPHPETDGWITKHPDGTESRTDFVIPTEPVIVPPEALGNSRVFEEGVQATHGALGRLLIWDRTQRWWIVNEPDLEVTLLCAPPGAFASADAEHEPFDWIRAFLTPLGVDRVRGVCARYDLPMT